jgi:hypothetical protein
MWDVLFDATVSQVFLTPFQDAPLDLDSNMSLFVQNRYQHHEIRLKELSSFTKLELFEHICSSWYLHRGHICRGISWDSQYCDPRFLLTVGVAIGGVTLSRIFATLSSDYHHFRGGLPDLLLWRTKTLPRTVASEEELLLFSPARLAVRGYQEYMEDVNADVQKLRTLLFRGVELEGKFVEVKGPRDSLMTRQEAWLQVLAEAATDSGSCCGVEVCHVQEKSWLKDMSGEKRGGKKQRA